jgi:hypothetical protein
MNSPRSILRNDLTPMKQDSTAFPRGSFLDNDLLDWDLLD